MQALYERFATRPWAALCGPAIYWAEAGHPVSSLELRRLEEELGF
jgi:gamma-glutamyltranspeptidase/glutathione hydrolase